VGLVFVILFAPQASLLIFFEQKLGSNPNPKNRQFLFFEVAKLRSKVLRKAKMQTTLVKTKNLKIHLNCFKKLELFYA
jgi:hypothetical protein